MSVWVIEGNTTARRFYEALGGGRSGVTKQIELSGVPVTEVEYVWDVRTRRDPSVQQS